MNWISPKEAPNGVVMLGWLSGMRLPSYKLISKKRNGKWELEGFDQEIPEAVIGSVMALPMPPQQKAPPTEADGAS